MGLLTLTPMPRLGFPIGGDVIYRCARCHAARMLYSNEDGDIECVNCGNVHYQPRTPIKRLSREAETKLEWHDIGVDWAHERRQA